MKSLTKTLILPILIFVFLYSNAQPGTKVEELNRKRHWVGGTYGHPYTMFDRHNGKSFEKTIEDIRNRIVEEKPKAEVDQVIFKAYQLVYDSAMKPMPTDNGMPKDGPSDLALWAKNNAFIMLVGLNRTADTLLDLPQRQLLKDKVITAFNNMSKDIPNKDGKYYTYFVGLGLTAVHPILGGLVVSAALAQQVYEETNVKNLFKFYSRSHILWLQAYDLLKASAALPELESIKYFDNHNSDANQGKHSPRNKLRSQTRNLYKMSKGFFGIVTHRFGWKLNHGIASVSAFLLSAQVLNDAGVETNILKGNFLYDIFGGPGYHPNYSPIKWHEFAREGLQENLFEGKHWPILAKDNPAAPLKTGKGEYSPYSEGPAYAIYGLVDCGIPAMRAEQNFFPEGSDELLLKKNLRSA